MSAPFNFTYTPINPNWFYSYVDIPNLEQIQKELINLSTYELPSWSTNKYYYNILAKTALEKCPGLAAYLVSVGLLDTTIRLLFSKNIDQQPQVAHVDSYNPQYCQHSLNIPLVDCKNSYTVWYGTKNTKLLDGTRYGLPPESNFASCPLEEAIELKRVEVTRPCVVNTTILHRGESNNPNRTICGIRFLTPLTFENMKALGIKKPFEQVV